MVLNVEFPVPKKLHCQQFLSTFKSKVTKPKLAKVENVYTITQL